MLPVSRYTLSALQFRCFVYNRRVEQLTAAQTTVAVPQWTVNRSPYHWTAPETFAPERWLETPPAAYKDDHLAIRNPFAVGPRNCIGRKYVVLSQFPPQARPSCTRTLRLFILTASSLAYNEMRSVLARVLWHFDLKLEAESQRWTEQKVFFFWEKPPLYVKMTARKDAHGKQ